MTDISNKLERPRSITIICVIGFIGALLTVPLIFSSIGQQVGAWYPPYLGFTAIIGLACMIGLWLMKKWAVYAYISLVVLNQIVLLTMGVWNFMALLIPAIIIFFGLKHISKMT